MILAQTIARRFRTTQPLLLPKHPALSFATLPPPPTQVYCDGDGKLCALGVDTNYRDLSLPTLDALPIPLHGQPIFQRSTPLQDVDASALRYLNAGTATQDPSSSPDPSHETSHDATPDASTEPTPDTLPPITPVAAAGWAHSAVVSSTGELWVWGRTHDMRNILRVNRKSRLQAWMMGTKRSTDTMVPGPVEVPGVGLPLARPSGIEALDVDNYALQLHDDDGETRLSFDDRVIGVACSAALTGCVTESGKAFLFGDNRVGQCGNSIPSEREWNPVRLRGLGKGERVMQMGLGYQHGVVCTASGRVYSWGKGDRGQMGVGGKRNEHTATAVPVFDKPPVRVVGPDESGGFGGSGGAVVGLDGVLRIDGRETNGVGEGVGGVDDREVDEEKTSVLESEVPDTGDPGMGDDHGQQLSTTAQALATHASSTTDSGLAHGTRPRAVGVGCGFAHSAALDHTGALWVWGKFLSTTLSTDGTRYADQFVPRQVEGIEDRIVQFTCGQFHTTALGASGRMWMIGMKSKNEMEPGDDVIDRFSPLPVEIPGSKQLKIKTLKGGWSTTTIVTRDGKVYDASWRGIRGPREELSELFVHDVAPGFRHRVVIGE